MNPQFDNNSDHNSAISDNKSDSFDSGPIIDPNNMVVPVDIKDDNDDPEEEWIHKAKAVVEQTKFDPYEQCRQLNRVKAAFLKTHYNKDIKVAEDDS